MSHYTVDYTVLKDETQKQNEAMKDIKSYLGDRFENLNTLLLEYVRDYGMTKDDFRSALAFAGIQGYPVGVWFERLKELSK